MPPGGAAPPVWRTWGHPFANLPLLLVTTALRVARTDVQGRLAALFLSVIFEYADARHSCRPAQCPASAQPCCCQSRRDHFSGVPDASMRARRAERS
jgi:hypothetical protein